MLGVFGDRQQELLKLLLKHKEGLAPDELASRLGITRPAIRQHLTALERQGYVERGERFATGGRPGQAYRLSAKGNDLFPKQYSWFSEVLLDSLKTQLGSQGLQELMTRLGQEVGAQASAQVPGETLPQRVRETAKLMTDLAYQAEAVATGKGGAGTPPVIEATNCVYHALATRFPEICQFDLSLLSKLTGAQVIHEQCIVRGGGACRFRFVPRKTGKS
jgi:DeoR family transcriptional regulator, suf operon transcriptional repressor